MKSETTTGASVVRRSSWSPAARTRPPARASGDGGVLAGQRTIVPGETRLLKRAIEQKHGGMAMHVKSVSIRGEIGNGRVYDTVVHVFELTGNPKAIRAYAWFGLGAHDGPHQIFTLLHTPHISSPRKAVRSAFLSGLDSE